MFSPRLPSEQQAQTGQGPSEDELFEATVAALDAPPAPVDLRRKLGWLVGSIAAFFVFYLLLIWLAQSGPTTLAGMHSAIGAVLALILVLFIHELGHFAGMRMFGYRDTSMFFIPGLGAAVTGTRHGVPAWQEAIMLLLGPLPGILIGAALLWWDSDGENRLWGAAALLGPLFIVINVLNLIPVKPLDGGKLFDLLLFARRPWLAVAFQALAALAIFAYVVLSAWLRITELGWSGAFYSMLVFAIPLLIAWALLASLRHRWSEIKAFNWLRAQLTIDLPHDLDHADMGQLRWLFDVVRQLYPWATTPAQLAESIGTVFHELTTRPAGWITTPVMLSLWIAGFAVSIAGLGLQSSGDDGASLRATKLEFEIISALIKKDRAGAEAKQREVVLIWEEEIKRWPRREVAQTRLVEALTSLSRIVEPAERRALLERAISLVDGHLAGDAANARSLRLQKARWEAASPLASLLWEQKEEASALTVLEQALAAADRGGEPGLQITIREALARRLQAMSGADDATQRLREAVALMAGLEPSSEDVSASETRDLDGTISSIAESLLVRELRSEATTALERSLAFRTRYVRQIEALGHSAKKGELTPILADAHQRLAWRLLSLRRFEEALAAADRSLAIGESAPYPQRPILYRAHALLLTGRVDEARAIYLDQRSKQATPDGGEPRPGAFEEAVASNFRLLRLAGVDAPAMTEIEAALGIKQ